MAHRAVVLFTFALAVTACGGAISESASTGQAQQGQQTQQTAQADAPPPPPPGATENAPPPGEPPCDGDRPPPPPPPSNGGVCGACIDEHFVCCSAPEPCAGFCVPDCRPAPERCPAKTACDQTSGVCLRQ